MSEDDCLYWLSSLDGSGSNAATSEDVWVNAE
jgi:hypothetical protein